MNKFAAAIFILTSLPCLGEELIRMDNRNIVKVSSSAIRCKMESMHSIITEGSIQITLSTGLKLTKQFSNWGIGEADQNGTPNRNVCEDLTSRLAKDIQAQLVELHETQSNDVHYLDSEYRACGKYIYYTTYDAKTLVIGELRRQAIATPCPK